MKTIRELEDLGYPAEKRANCLSLLVGIPRLAINEDILTLAQHYVQNRVMPSNDMGDAFHLAFATYYRLEYLVTWNCKHLANANKFEMIEALHRRLRMVSPRIVTPEQLMEMAP